MIHYVEKYLKEKSKKFNMSYEDLLTLISNEYENEYGKDIKKLARLQKLSILNYCYYKDMYQYSYLLRLIILVNKIEREYF